MERCTLELITVGDDISFHLKTGRVRKREGCMQERQGMSQLYGINLKPWGHLGGTLLNLTHIVLVLSTTIQDKETVFILTIIQ